MIRSSINKIKITAQHIDRSSSDPEAALGFAVVLELFADDPVSLLRMGYELVKVQEVNHEFLKELKRF